MGLNVALTLALSPRRGDCSVFSLSLRERVGVRGMSTC
jgi:hypothetical protein